jgi:hypothetical protein
MPKTIGNISLYMGPQQLGGPDGLLQSGLRFNEMHSFAETSP